MSNILIPFNERSMNLTESVRYNKEMFRPSPAFGWSTTTRLEQQCQSKMIDRERPQIHGSESGVAVHWAL
jgi:hypothetical protein